MGDPSESRGRSRLLIVLLIVIALFALTIRFIQLDTRPMHGDEANQAYKTGALLETGRYVYDPNDHHGPTLYYLALIPAWLTGKTQFAETNEITYRTVPVLFGAGLILLLIPLRYALGSASIVFTALLLAVSPAFVFYSRYYIQEMLLVFFTFSAIVCAWRYYRRPGLAWALATGLCLSLMHATKETAIIAYFSMACALVATVVSKSGVAGGLKSVRQHLVTRHVLSAIALSAAVSVVLYTAFFTNLRGPLDSVLTYANYFERAGGAGIHDKPWHYYLGLLAFTRRSPQPWWSEGFVLAFAVIGLAIAFRPRRATFGDPSLFRFLAIYTLIMMTVYALIPYKTPWTMLSFYHGMIVLAGIGLAGCLHAAPNKGLKVGLLFILAVGLAHLGRQTYLSETKYFADVVNPYVYAHTSSTMPELAERAEELAALHPDAEQIVIRVVQPDADYWPIPWYFREFPNVGYWHAIPDEPDAPMIIADPALRPLLDAALGDEYFVYARSLRPGVLRAIYVEKSLHDAFVETRK